ncbi:MAG: protein-methionine-sulfoxide reductase catalytic subunit MsrP [Anaerolineaceae bacterium]|jgi:sulfoxide reductase catalytic subunit YedY|nr:protein-methionine-sulfoxide reductase catalytic subunit MsrP [Anaerolineaceae bacterium]
MQKIPSSEITPEHLYYSRRDFLKKSAIFAGSLSILSACKSINFSGDQQPEASFFTYKDEFGDLANTYEQITNYNNYYEFFTNKESVADLSKNLKTDPWKLEIKGLVQNPLELDMDDLSKLFEQEEKVFRLRCVEGWSKVIPWTGLPLKKLLSLAEPASEARYVRFQTLYDPEQMPAQQDNLFPWPYLEGLRLDEAMHDLTLLATGMYGKQLLPQSGAPIRLVVPWKYGFKSIKSIVKIELLKEQPVSLWMAVSPREYGFYANVNPNIPHPRWSQSTERRIGEMERRPTLLFNGYETEVAHLYKDLDLSVNF